MQLPADEALVQVSGVAPIRAKKARFYLDRELASRVASAPEKPAILLPAEVSEWVSVLAAAGERGGKSGEDDEGGLRLEPELDVPPEPVVALEEVEVGLDPDIDSDDAVQVEQSRRFRTAARLAALDPDDGIPL